MEVLGRVGRGRGAKRLGASRQVPWNGHCEGTVLGWCGAVEGGRGRWEVVEGGNKTLNVVSRQGIFGSTLFMRETCYCDLSSGLARGRVRPTSNAVWRQVEVH